MEIKKSTFFTIITIVVLTPILLGIVLNIPGGHLTIGDESSWVGFFGNYSGGIIGGVVAYIIASFQVKQEHNARLQDKEMLEEEIKTKQLDEERYIKNIISLFLYDEIVSNFRILIKQKSYIEALERRIDDVLTPSFTFNVPLKFDEFDKVRFDLIKYDNQEVKEVIEFYRICKIITYEPETSKMSKNDAKSIVDVILKWNNKFKE